MYIENSVYDRYCFRTECISDSHGSVTLAQELIVSGIYRNIGLSAYSANSNSILCPDCKVILSVHHRNISASVFKSSYNAAVVS